jgi:hypothetical protein
MGNCEMGVREEERDVESTIKKEPKQLLFGLFMTLDKTHILMYRP